MGKIDKLKLEFCYEFCRFLHWGFRDFFWNPRMKDRINKLDSLYDVIQIESNRIKNG